MNPYRALAAAVLERAIADARNQLDYQTLPPVRCTVPGRGAFSSPAKAIGGQTPPASTPRP